MKKLALVLPLLGMLPLSAQDWEVGVLGVSNSYRTSGSAQNGTIDPGSPDSKVALGLRVGYALLDLGPMLLQVTAGIQPQSTTKVTSRGTSGYDFSPTTTNVNFKNQNYSVGAMLNMNAFLSGGIGLEYRFETYEYQGFSTSASRPWLRANLGVSIPSPILKPFAGVEADLPFTSTKLGDGTSADDRARSMAPKAQFGLYAGIRF